MLSHSRPLLSSLALVVAIATGCASANQDDGTGASEGAITGRDVACSRALRGLGKCALPPSTCASPLGSAVARDVWGSTHENGTVPTERLYTSKNAWAAPYVDAPAIFGGMAKAIRDAHYEVDLETYEWGPTVFARTDVGSGERWGTDPTTVIMEALVDLQKRLESDPGAPRPVQVRFVIDSGDGWQRKMDNLSRQLREIALDPALVAVRFGAHIKTIAEALHSKLLVVDGYKAIVTGANPQSQQGLVNHWHDTGYAVKGEIGAALQTTFDDTWAGTDEVHCTPACVRVGKGTAFTHAPAVAQPDLDGDPDLQSACTPMFATTRRGFGLTNALPPPPENVDNPQDRAFLSMFSRAANVIKLESPNLNDHHVKDGLLAAAKRGVDVRIILPLGFNSGAERSQVIDLFGKKTSLAGGSNEDSVAELYRRAAETGVCNHLHVRWNSMRDGSRPSWNNEVPGASHTKYTSIDGQIAMVGSANHDVTSWQLIRETNVLLDSHDATAAYDAAVFDHDWTIGFDVAAWARNVQAGAVVPADGTNLDALLGGGGAKAWADGMVDACPL